MAAGVNEEVPRLDLNAEYTSISELNYAVSQYEVENMCKLYKRRTRTIASTIKRAPKRTFNEAICFTELYLCCVRGGMKFRSQSTGKRPKLGTVKKECPFMVTIKASKDGQKLVVYAIQEIHNHSINKNDVSPEVEPCVLLYPHMSPEAKPCSLPYPHISPEEQPKFAREENTWKSTYKLNNLRIYTKKKIDNRCKEDELKESKRKSSFWEWEGEYTRKKLRVENKIIEFEEIEHDLSETEERNNEESESQDHNEEEYQVEHILMQRKKHKKTQYLIKWQGLDQSESTWVLEENLEGYEEMLATFHNQTKCFCGDSGYWYDRMLECQRCKHWFHESCVACLRYNLIPGDQFYCYVCEFCNQDEEFIYRLPLDWKEIVHLALFNLSHSKNVQAKVKSVLGVYFDYKEHITPWINYNWDSLQCPQILQTISRKKRHKKIVKALMANKSKFKCGIEIGKKKSLFSLLKMAPPSVREIVLPEDLPITEASMESISFAERTIEMLPVLRNFKVDEHEWNESKIIFNMVQFETKGIDTAPSRMKSICQMPIQIKEEPPPYIIEDEVFTSKLADELKTENSLLCLNATYSSISELRDAISQYEQHNMCKLYKRRSRSIAAALKRTPKKKFNEAIAITELELCCIHGGKTFKSRSTGKRPNRLRTSQTACPFIINAKASIDGQKLVISRMEENHNHVISKVPIRVKGKLAEDMEEHKIKKERIGSACGNQSNITKKRMFKDSKEGLQDNNWTQVDIRKTKKTTNLVSKMDTSFAPISGNDSKGALSKPMATKRPLQQKIPILVKKSSTGFKSVYKNPTVIDSETSVIKYANDLADSVGVTANYASFIQKNIFG